MPDNSHNNRESELSGQLQGDNDSHDKDSSAYNIERSKQLIKTLERTTLLSATMVQKARAFHETHKMLTVSKKMSEECRARLNLTVNLAVNRRTCKVDDSELE